MRLTWGTWAGPAQISGGRENMKLINVPKPFVLKRIDGFSTKIWVKLAFVFD